MAHRQMATTRLALTVPLAEPVAEIAVRVRGLAPSVQSEWVKFNAHERTELAKHLGGPAIEELASACNLAGALYHARKANPISVSAIRVHLLKVAEVAAELKKSLDFNTRHALTLVSLLERDCGAERGMPNALELSRLLDALAAGCTQQAKLYVGQARRQTPEYQVRCIARVLEASGLKTSAAPGSRFIRLVRICFDARRRPPYFMHWRGQ